ncbi:hypothetical protein PR048_014082, partial [Dryococelus australis]
MFSDACGDQNLNRLACALTMQNRFKIIHQYYPIKGHSFMPCDRNFGTLDTCAKKPIITFHMESDQCDTFKKWWPQYFLKLLKSNEDRVYFKISAGRHFIFTNAHIGYV